MLTGYAHLLFLFGAIFFLTQLKDILKFITASTIVDSITLVFATLYGIQANYYLIDAVIALILCYKAFDNLDGFKKYQQISSPSLVAMMFVFVLIHGFGLSTRLQQLTSQRAWRLWVPAATRNFRNSLFCSGAARCHKNVSQRCQLGFCSVERKLVDGSQTRYGHVQEEHGLLRNLSSKVSMKKRYCSFWCPIVVKFITLILAVSLMVSNRPNYGFDPLEKIPAQTLCLVL